MSQPTPPEPDESAAEPEPAEEQAPEARPGMHWPPGNLMGDRR